MKKSYVIQSDGSIVYDGKPTDAVREKAERELAEMISAGTVREVGSIVEEEDEK